MKRFFLIYLIFSIKIGLAQNYHNFDENQEVYLYGDNVKLRESPNTEATVIKLLPIGEKIIIKKKTNKLFDYNGIPTHWYLINYKGVEGYIVGGLISLKKHKSLYYPNGFFVYNMSKEKERHYENIYVNIRFVENNKIIDEIKIKLFGNGNFKIINSDNKGIEKAKDIIIIDNYSEACGVDGGKSYIIYNGKALIHMADTSEIGDGDIYHYESSFTFPNDKDGIKGVIIYKKEEGEKKDEETNWYVTISQVRELKWDGEKLIPENYDKDNEQ